MNKRIYFILLPILALLVSSFGMPYQSVPVSKAPFEINITAISARNTLTSSNLKKQENKIDINAMRIKAKHDVVAINIPVIWEPATLFAYHPKVYNGWYSVYELCAFHAGYHLRGPPTVA